ncbi:Spy0128 family protein [Streptococcus anginosus]|uniref:Spy0128 family protein n=1 Tax=Streptococcus anginosus TaxID=1328 RepID=UPI0020005D6C|nr:FctA domain-containing protein [Streptococcus anginosus]
MIKKAMNLVGVALLLASTILSPASALAQTLSNQSSAVTTQSATKTGVAEQLVSSTEPMQKTVDTSSSQGQQPATENKAEANSNEQENKPSTSKEESSDASQVKEDTSSQKASKVEEKSETQPGAPPAAKDTKDTQAAPKTQRAPKEIDAITKFSITDHNGKPLDKPLQQWEQFKIDGQFKLPNNDVHEGDYTTFKISENLVLVSTPNFDIKDKDGQVVARATIDPENRLLKLTYTKYVENKSDVSGSFYFYTYVNHHIVKEKKKVPLQITVNRNIVPIGEVEFGGLTPPSQKDLTKVGNFKPDNTITYDITVNQSGKEIPDAKVTDILKTPNISYVKDSFEIYKGKWVIKDNRWVLKNKKTVTTQFNVEFLSDSEFSIKLGKINKDEGYHIKYKAKANYKLQSGEVVENVTSLWSSQTKIIDSIAKTTYLEAGGSAEGYVYSITLHKKDETSGASLAGAVFRVTRDRNGAVVGDFTTDSTGKVTIPNLLKDNYTIKEIKAPDGYQLTGKEIKVKPENFNSSKSYSLDISNKRQKVSATLQVNKKLVGRKLKAQEFEFDLVDNTEVSPTVGKILQTVKNNANGEVNFKSLEYTKAGTYEYFIRENKGSAPGVTYDQKFITVTVEVKEKSGKLEVSKVTYMTDGEEIKKPTFNNRYTPVKTSAKLEVKKVLTGRPLQEGEFEFELKDLQRNKKILETVKNTADGKVQFKELKYTKAGIYHYTISEKAGDVPGVEYEPNLISATVTVEDKGGKLEVTKITYSKAGEETKDPTFINQYTPGKTFARLEVNKILTGRQLQKDEFEFELKEDGKPDVLQTAKNDAQGKVQFQVINYDKAGEYHYTITEKNNGLTGVTYDSSKVKVTVKVTDDGKGKLRASVTYDGGKKTFKNTFTPKEITVPLQVTKALTGRNLQDDEFEFELYDGQNKLLQTVKNKADGTIPFKALKFTKTGLYNYLIKEKAGKVPGVDYDKQPIKVTIRVQQEEDGQLIYNIVYLGLDESGKNQISKQSFTNKYTAKGTDATFSVTKKLTGRALKDGEFSFDLKEDGKADVLQTKKNDKYGKVQFDAIKYQTVGTHKYTITEKNTGLGGVTYDTKTIKVTVEVTDNGKGQLVSKVTYENNDQTFNNTYSSQKVSAQLSVTKELTGRALNDQEFEFELVGSDDNVRQTKKNATDGRVTFDAIDYTKVGTYHYTIKEKDNGLGGVTYDKKEIKATVKVTDDGNGQLVAQVSYDTANPTFRNTYLAKETTATLEANKVLTGRELKANEFAFDLIDPNGKVVDTVKNAKDGKISFKELTFKTAGTYTYTIKEQAGALGGVKYDTKVIKATVTVTDDGKGQLHTTVAYENNQNTFTNTYSADKATATLSAKKLLEGRNLKEGEFEFELTGTDDQVRQTKTNAQDGSVTFDTIEYTKVGTYHYTITEKDTKLGGVKYDTKVIKATVTVTDDGQGRLVTKVSYEKDDQTFKNTYSAAKTNAQLSVKKALTGRALKDGEFEFELKGQDDKVTQSKKNAQDGSVTFDTIEYTKTGTYHYTITEKNIRLGGVTYDKKVIKATVTVTDNGQGQLVAQVAYEQNDQTFTNQYQAAPTDAQLSANKQLSGRDLKTGEFSFELKNDKDEVLETVTNDKDGKITFKKLTYTAVGTYQYTITEKDTKLGGVKYDTKVIKATVTVTDNGAGKLVATVSYDTKDRVFNNTYTADSVQATVEVTKKLVGRTLKANEFEFVLKDERGQVLQTKKNTADGSVNFDAFEYKTTGTYHYTIAEKDTKLQGITYDKKVIKVTVTVTDDGNGHLVAKVSYDKNIKTFENRYTPPKKGLPKTGTVIHTVAIFIGLIVLVGAVYLIKKKS